MNQSKVRIEFDDQIVRYFVIATLFWAIISLTAGVLIAAQMNFWQMNGKFLEWLTFGLIQSDGISYLTFGRLRPLHTNAAIFAFVGNMMFAGIYYSTQRLCKVRLASRLLSWLHFWGWQAIILSAAITLPAGFTRGKEYAELIWPINILVVLVWVIFAINFFWTLKRRNEPTLYVAIWFYIATIVTVAMLYIVNHLSIPTSLLHSYPIFGGVQDALVQWWYGHNAVAFFLTTPILGIMYYFLPKAAGRPVYSYRLSVIHFWALVFIYIWAGPHHLLNTALPNWLQVLGMLFSLMLWAPSWAGMLNGLLTLRGAWDKLRTDPIIKFFAAAVTFYGMATFEGPLLSIKAVNALGHYTDWIVGHVHAGTLGWNGFMAAGMIYWLAPRLWGTKLYSTTLANMHFWLGMVGILLYVSAMWVSGIGQGLMLSATKEAGTVLSYPGMTGFLETNLAIRPAMLFRLIGGGLYLIGFALCAWNVYKTIRQGAPVNGSIEVAGPEHEEDTALPFWRVWINPPVFYCTMLIIFVCLWLFGNDLIGLIGLFASIFFVLMAIVHFQTSGDRWADWYNRLLANAFPFTVLTLIAAAIGGTIQIIPLVTLERAHNIEGRVQVPYTPLELAGRDIYVAEGCYNCHSQMIRTLVSDVMRYGPGEDAGYSRLGESIYDYPYQWGSKRTGPDLARTGTANRRSNYWHYRHMLDPRDTSPGSNMPAYPWLFEQNTHYSSLPGKINVMRMLGVPYPDHWTPSYIIEDAQAQAQEVAEEVYRDQIRDLNPDWTPEQIRRRAQEMAQSEADHKIMALIAYLQKLGVYEIRTAEVK